MKSFERVSHWLQTALDPLRHEDFRSERLKRVSLWADQDLNTGKVRVHCSAQLGTTFRSAEGADLDALVLEVLSEFRKQAHEYNGSDKD